ncbi:TIGR02594 family protein [Aeromonas cavernicola]|uniref:LysM domain-containing protein n=1 Tax=Aeromonas cavernicola TaxID=1006623 RepID=A0A2H9U6H0_9GAMM|nr:TIGR02594 family protein [Aeromonas cavernicola]PJG59630.1 hypothetical protein CUC53_06240 [Aeromonas cavernicola]
MTKWIACLYDGKTKTAQYEGAEGTCLLRRGGTLPWRTNNPGNLRPRMVNGKPQPKKVTSHIGFAKTQNNGFFLIFSSYEVGFAELKKNLLRMHGDKTVENGIRAYAPSHENNTSKYISDLEKLSGVSRLKIINRLTDSELDDVAHAIEIIEGYHNSKDTRKEVTTKLSNVILSDGSKPISGQVVVLKSGNIKKEFITDDYGFIPPIPHIVFTCTVNVCVPNPIDGSVKDIAIIEPNGPAKNILAVFDGVIAKAKTMPLEPPAGQLLPKRKKIQYTIKSGDSLWKVAKTFKTSVDSIVEANNIKDPTRIYPGTKIWILPKANNGTEVISAQSAIPKKNQSKSVNTTTVNVGEKPNKTLATVAVETARDSKGKPLAMIPLMEEEAPWMEVAIREAKKWHGTKEKNITDNYHALTGNGWIKDLSGRSNAWCASFISYCLQEVGYKKPRNSQRARSFREDTSRFVEIKEPIYGCIASNGSHVTFYYGDGGNGVIIGLGGNQGDTIKFSNYTGMRYIIPISYYEKYKEVKKNAKKKFDVDELNKGILINEKTQKNESVR